MTSSPAARFSLVNYHFFTQITQISWIFSGSCVSFCGVSSRWACSPSYGVFRCPPVAPLEVAGQLEKNKHFMAGWYPRYKTLWLVINIGYMCIYRSFSYWLSYSWSFVSFVLPGGLRYPFFACQQFDLRLSMDLCGRSPATRVHGPGVSGELWLCQWLMGVYAQCPKYDLVEYMYYI